MTVTGHATKVRGFSLDEVYSAIVKHNRRPLMVSFVEPLDQQPTTKRNEQHQGVTLQQSQQPTDGDTDKEKSEDDTHRRSVRKYLSEKGMEACTDGVCRALAQHGTERGQWLSTLTTMAPATQRDLLEAVRAQYARDSPLRSLGKFALYVTVCNFTLTLSGLCRCRCFHLALRADTMAAFVRPAIDGTNNLSVNNKEAGERKLLTTQTFGRDSAGLLLDESVEQSHALESNVD